MKRAGKVCGDSQDLKLPGQDAQNIQPHTARNYEFTIKGKAVDIPCFPEKSIKVC